MWGHAGPPRQWPADRQRPLIIPGTVHMRWRNSMHRKPSWRGIAMAVGVVALAVAAGDAHAQKKGGVIKIGNLGEPPSLDPHWGTQTITEVLSNHIYEGLYTLDASYRPMPMLAEAMPTVSRDGLT